jgi:hypothetical protein
MPNLSKCLIQFTAAKTNRKCKQTTHVHGGLFSLQEALWQTIFLRLFFLQIVFASATTYSGSFRIQSIMSYQYKNVNRHAITKMQT